MGYALLMKYRLDLDELENTSGHLSLKVSLIFEPKNSRTTMSCFTGSEIGNVKFVGSIKIYF